jgi:hypothetical protein
MIDKVGPLTSKFKDDYKVPMGENVEKWSRIISKIAYDHCNLYYQSWSKVPNEMVKGLEKCVNV